MVSSATASALRPGARSTGTPASVAAATSTLFGITPAAAHGNERQFEQRAGTPVALDDGDGGTLGLHPLGQWAAS